MTSAQRSLLKRLGTIGSIAWLIGVGWLMWATLPYDALETHSSDSLKDRMSMECSGSFKDRYNCKEALIIESGQEAFITLSLRFLLVIVPPLVISTLVSSYLRRHPAHDHPHSHHQDGNWKNKAKLHSTQLSPEQAAEDLHLDDQHHYPEKFHHRIEDIAPMDDWKAKANRHVRTPDRQD